MTGPDPDMPHALYRGRVMHARLRPFEHRFSYPVFSVLLDIDRLDSLPALMSYNRPNLFGFQDRDHGTRDGAPLRPWVEERLRAAGVTPPGGRIRLLCFPRVLGFVFNPLSVFYCDTPDGRPGAVLYEVKNTFGDQHTYACAIEATAADTGSIGHSHPKEFHVSPFFGMGGAYRFRLSPPGERLSVMIRYADAQGDLLIATQTGRHTPLTAGSLLRAFAALPFSTLQVVLGIHWEAFKLWRKGAVFHRRPDPPVHPIRHPSRMTATTTQVEATGR